MLKHTSCFTSFLYTIGSQISHTLVLVRLSLGPWGLGRLRRAWGNVGGTRVSSLPMQTCMAWGNWQPAFKALTLL